MTAATASIVRLNIDKPKYKIGDKVVIRSGGLPMTVVYCTPQEVTVAWFAQRLLHRTSFPVEAVERHKKEKRYASV